MNYKMYVIFFILFIIGYGIMTFVIWKTKGNKSKQYLEKYPNASKIYVPYTHHIKTEVIKIHTIDDEEATHGTLPNFYYCKPGKDIKLELNWSSSRPGILYKTVNNYTDVVEIYVDIEPNKEYKLSYNKSEETFEIKEK